MMPTALSVLAAEESGSAHPILLGVGVFALFVVLLLITLQFNRDR